MRCQKCGGEYVSLQKSENMDDGIIIQTFYCAECKNTYKVRIENPPLQGFKKIMTVYTRSYPYQLGLYQKKIGFLDTKGKYSFHPMGMIRFSYDSIYIEFLFQKESPENPNICTGLEVRDFKVEPEYEAGLLNMKAYQLKDEALKCHVPELSSDLVEILNNMLISASGNKRILVGERKKHPKNGSNGCYIATSVYGSYDCPQFCTLRRYRRNVRHRRKALC